jgi:transposase-like protein
VLEQAIARRPDIAKTDEGHALKGPAMSQSTERRIRRPAPCRGDKWHLDEVVTGIAGKKQWWFYRLQPSSVISIARSASSARSTFKLADSRLSGRRVGRVNAADDNGLETRYTRAIATPLRSSAISVTHETIRQWGLKFGREFGITTVPS